MALKYERTIAFFCPYCSGLSEHIINIFKFSGNTALSLDCKKKKCGNTCVTITPKKDKYSIYIECPVCGENHTFSISKGAFWSRDLISFTCPMASDADIIFIGKKRAVKQAIIEPDTNEQDYSDNLSISLYALVEHINQLLCEDKIYCHCGSFDIVPDISENNFTLSCCKCNSEMSIEITQENVDKLLNSPKLIIP